MYLELSEPYHSKNKPDAHVLLQICMSTAYINGAFRHFVLISRHVDGEL